VKLDAIDFEIFGVPARFAQDRAELDARWKALQGSTHPDRFAAEGAAAQRAAMQWAVRVNEAYRRLKDPLARAAYLCELNGAPVDVQNNTAMPQAFLLEQMHWREALDDASDVPAVEALAGEIADAKRKRLAELADTIDARHDWPAAAQQVRALMFVVRLQEEIERRLEALEPR
jgi:molecular chaperone HscB